MENKYMDVRNNRVFFGVIFFILNACVTPIHNNVFTAVPNDIKDGKKYILYLHGVDVEVSGIQNSQEQYINILNAFSDNGFIVISEARSKDTEFYSYSEKTANDVSKLIDYGVSPQNITVVGYSKGGRLALRSSAILGNNSVNFVLLAGCVSNHRDWYEIIMDIYAPDLKGKILSIYDENDKNFGSCHEFTEQATAELEFKEIILKSGKGNQVFHSPLRAWLNPTIEWAISHAIP